MLGAIAGDMIGSVYEGMGRQIKTEEFPLFTIDSHFTDDTVLTVAVAEAILQKGDYARTIYAYGRHYPHAGYGGSFRRWLENGDLQPYHSFGNGSAMRASPVGWAFDTVEAVLEEAERSAAVTHNHPEGIKGAQAVALAVYLARNGSSKDAIREQIQERFRYDLWLSVDDIRPYYHFDVTCQGSVPQSIIAFLDSNSVEDSIRKAISLGGDSDTMACIAGSIAEAFYGGVPEAISKEVYNRLPVEFQHTLDKFSSVFMKKG